MKSNDILHAIGSLDDDIIRNAKAPQKVRRLHWHKWAGMAASFALVVAFGVGAWQSGVFTTPDDPIATHPIDKVPQNPHSSVNTPTVEDLEDTILINLADVYVNDLDPMAPDAARLWRDPALYDEVLWNWDALTAYYGRDMTPAYIPDGLAASANNNTAKVILDKNGTVVEDTVWLSFYREQATEGMPEYLKAGFQITASRLGILNCCLYIHDEVKISDINGTDVTFGCGTLSYGPYDPETHEPSGYYDLYTAEFMLDGVEYQIVAEQMKLNEVVKVVASMIYGTDKVTVTDDGGSVAAPVVDVPVVQNPGSTGALVPFDEVWGGSYLNASGQWVVLLTEDTPENRQKVFALNPSLKEENTVFQTAAYSYAYLTELLASISKAMANGNLPLVSTAGIYEDRNCIEVTMMAEDADALSKIMAFDALGGAITVKYAEGTVAATDVLKTTLTDDVTREGCFVDPSNPVSDQNYHVGEPVVEE